MKSIIDKQYFEGILQLRNPNKEVINYIEKRIKEKSSVFLAKKVDVVNGIDFYISSNRFLRSLGRRLQKQFGGELKISPRLYSRNRQTSRDVYRLNVLFRLPEYKKGDIVTVKGEKIKILSLGKKVFGKNLVTGRKVRFGYGELKSA